MYIQRPPSWFFIFYFASNISLMGAFTFCVFKVDCDLQVYVRENNIGYDHVAYINIGV